MASSLAFLQPLSNVSSSSTLLFLRNPHHIPSSSSSLKPSNFPKSLPFKSLTASFSLAESDSPKSFQPKGSNFQSFLQELADSFDLPPDYFAQLPNDLRLDLNDAAFDLSNGRVIDEKQFRTFLDSFVKLSLGDARAYYLSTAKNELGVISAQSAASGETMVPISWTEMQCPRTGQIEQRKVAKVGG